MGRIREEESSKQIIAVVLELLESDGYDAVQLREVARRARVSIATIYQRFGARDELIVAAVEQWMATNTYAAVEPPSRGESLHDGLMRILGYVVEPWERHPRMLEAYHRARTGSGGQRLDEQGVGAILPAAAALFADADPDYVADIGLVLANMFYALIGRFVDRNLAITEFLPILERAVFRLTSDNESLAAAACSDDSARQGAPVRPVDPTLVGPYGPRDRRR
ncbi:TetR family transcriptional regulator [Nocardia callitridis]|uniref:TetR/AcrR family transcriptional regulator n=1 Tax=Nocardia callitridis TaxID=648753 RepID=A0ABP9KFJ9_9NOCA